MNVAVMRTKVEEALSENFEAVAEKLPGGKAVAEVRRKAIGLFGEKGLPHRRIEEWKYTDLRAALKDAPQPSVGDATKITIADVIVAMGPLEAIDAYRVTFVNGAYRPELSSIKGAAGLEMKPLGASLAEAQDKVGESLTRFGGPGDDVLIALNTAYMTDGAVVRIAEGKTLAKPLLVLFVGAGASRRMTATRNMISVGKGAAATIVEAYLTLPGAAGEGQANAATEVVVGEGANVTHVKCAMETGAVHLASLVATLNAGATYRSFQLTAGPALARNQIFATFAGEEAKLDLSGAFLARGTAHADTTLVVDHAVPRCESRELYKGVLDGEAKGVFQGKVIVRPDAQKSDGKQMAQVLMLSPDVEFDSKPELEIYADDVVCGHGSTSAEIDDEHLFYCKSRGIPEAEARALLTEAFVGEAIEKVDSEPVREALLAFARQWLKAK
jgi:Fe-S cluster assembly protein SufD